MKPSSLLTSTAIGLVAAAAVLTDTWLYVFLAVPGLLFALFALTHPRAGLFAWLLLAPVANAYATVSLPGGVPDITFGRVTIAVVVIAVLLRLVLKGQRLVAAGGVELAMLALLFVLTLDLVMRSSDLTSDALQHFDERITPLLLFLAARNLCVYRRDLRYAAYILAAVGCYLALHGTYQYVTSSTPDITAAPGTLTVREGGQRVQESHLEQGRAVGPFGSAVEYGSVAAIAFVATLLLALRCTGVARAVPLAALIPIGAAVVLSATRSAWLGVYLGVIAIALLDRQRRVALLAATAAVTVAVAAGTAMLAESSTLRERASSVEPIYGRLVMYRAALNLVAARPISGYGRGAPSRVAARREVMALGGPYADLAPGQFHNVFVMTLVEWGIFGLAAYVALLALIVKGALDLHRRLAAQRDFVHAFAGFFLAATVVYLIQGLFTDIPPFAYLNGVYFFLAGLVFARLDALDAATETEPHPAIGEAVTSGA